MIFLEASGQLWCDDMRPWHTDESCMSLIICNISFRLLSGFKDLGHLEINLWQDFEYLQGTSLICYYHRKYLITFESAEILNSFSVDVLFSCTIHFNSIQLFSSLMMKCHWLFVQKLTRKAEKHRLLSWLTPVKMNSLTSEHSVLLDWKCLPASFCQCQEKKRKEKRRRQEKEEKSLALPDAHLPLRRDQRKKSQEVQGSQINPSLSLSLLTSLSCSLAWQMYIVRGFKQWAKRTYLWLIDFRDPWRTAKWIKSLKIQFAKEKENQENS